MPELVSLDRLAGRLGVVPEHANRLLEQHGSALVPDWSGRPSVPAEVAAEIVDAADRQRAERLDQERAYRSYERAWYAERDRIANDAAREGHEQGRREEVRAMTADGRTSITNGWAGGRRAAMAGIEASREALAAYERKDPLLDFGEWTKKKGHR